MKHLPKHLRPRWRYLAVELETWPDVSIDRGEFQRHLWYAAQNLVGDAGSAEVDLAVYGFEHGDGTGEAVVRTRHTAVDEARSIVCCLSTIGDQPVGVRVRGIAGTVKSCEEKYLGRQPEVSRERRVVFEDAERRAVERDGAVDIRIDGAFAGATTLDFE